MSREGLTEKFPLEESFLDFSGHSRSFQLTLDKRPTGDFYVEARELSGSAGYRFEVYSPVFSEPAIGSALGKLRQKIRSNLATRHLHTDSTGRKSLANQQLRGRIANDGVVVDGGLLTFEEIQTILREHEGFEIQIIIGSE